MVNGNALSIGPVRKLYHKGLRRVFLIISLVTFATSVYQLTRHWDYQETLVDIGEQLHRKVSADDIVSELQTSIQKSEFDQARMYLTIARENHYPIDYERYNREIDARDTTFARLSKNAYQFAKGFIEGKSSSTAGIAGALSADFTVIGDARDLHTEYSKMQKGEDVNRLIVVLSGAGIGLTVLTVGSMGAAAPAKSGMSLIKLAAKTRRLSARFQKQLLRLGNKIFDWQTFTRLVKQSTSIRQIPQAAKLAYHPKAIGPLKKIAKQVNSVRKSTSVADTLQMIKYIETTDDLRHLEKVSLKYGKQTRGILTLLGKGALRTVRVLRKTTVFLISLMSSILSAIFSLVLLLAAKRT